MRAAADSANNFDFLRFMAAILVWYCHCYDLSGFTDPVTRHLHTISTGNLGVCIFFIISGYFVTQSYEHNGLAGYARNRALRILPALCVVVLLSVFLLGPLVTALPLKDYFASAGTWQYLRSMSAFSIRTTLPGVFEHNPVRAVNNALWTLPYETRLYVAVMVLGVLSALRPRVAFLLFGAVVFLRLYVRMPFLPFTEVFSYASALQLSMCFAGGACLYLARGRIPLRACYLALALAVMAGGEALHLSILFDLGLIYAVICFGFMRLPFLSRFGQYGDFSYGFYLYAFPVHQVVYQYLGVSHMGLFMAVTFTTILACAMLSWNFIEKPALALKK